MKTITLPIFNIIINLQESKYNYYEYSGTISSNLRDDLTIGEELMESYINQIDTIEAMILAHACAGVDVSSESYLNGILTVVDKISQ